MAWTIVVLVRGGRRGKAARGAGRRFHAERPTAYEELQDLMRRAAEKGAFREAIRLMMLSLLQLLDRTGAVRVQDGKTNGEYVREYSPRRPGREAFTRFVLAFDEAVYGSARCDGHTYRDMNVRFDQARGNVKG